MHRETKDSVIKIRLTEAEKRELALLAVRRGCSMSEVVRAAALRSVGAN